MDRKAHWDQVYTTKQPTEISWYQAKPTCSLELLHQVGVGPETLLIDVGGGNSTLVDAVVTEGLGRMTVLDISAVALARARRRLGVRAREVTWLEGDVTQTELPVRSFDVWHDRAVFHFLTEVEDRARYMARATATVRPGGNLIIATFALEGPTRCSGLDVVRYDPEGLARELSDAFELRRSLMDLHRTPHGDEQLFTYAVFERRR